MEIFLVGGAIRDELLGKPIKERDWVVVSATPEELIALHFQPVGKDFPVFLHPVTHEEYALARTERKISKGYKGFQFYATPDVSLKEDLERRDLTINAMAKSEKGELIDPYGGQADLKARVLRHVSFAFAEDPVRILRVARFASLLPDFHVHPKTNDLMKKMVENGEADALVAERVWKELSRALENQEPLRFFEVLSQCHALSILFPGLSIHDPAFSSLKRAAQLSKDPAVRFAVLFCFMQKEMFNTLCRRYRIPTDFAELTKLTAKLLHQYEKLDIHNAKMILNLLRSADAFRRPGRFLQFITTCRIANTHDIDQSFLLKKALETARSIDTQSLLKQGLSGEAFGKALYEKQLEKIAACLCNERYSQK